MKFFCLIAALTVSLTGAWPSSAAQAESLILENKTGRTICEVYLASANADDWAGWGGDRRCLESGRKWNLKPQSSMPARGTRDLRVIFDDGSDRTYFGLDLDLFAYVILGDMEAELFEWAPSGRPAR